MQENSVAEQVAVEDPRELAAQLSWIERELSHTQDRAARMKSLMERRSAGKLKPAKKARLVRRFTVADAYAKQVEQVLDQVKFRLSQVTTSPQK